MKDHYEYEIFSILDIERARASAGKLDNRYHSTTGFRTISRRVGELRRGICLALFTNPEGDSCFSIYQSSWIKIKKELFVNFNLKRLVGTLFTLQTFRGFCQMHFYDFIADSARK